MPVYILGLGMTDLEAFLVTSVSSAATWGALTWLIQSWLAVRINESVKNEYAIKFEQLRNDAARQREAEAVATGAFSATHLAAHGRRLDAVDKLWQAVQLPFSKSPAFVCVIDSATADELPERVKEGPIVDGAKAFHATSVAELLGKSTLLVEPIRPYLGEDVYRMFFWYRAFVADFLMHVVDLPSTGTFPPWQQDAGALNALGRVLEPTELDQLRNQRYASWAVAREAIQLKILGAMSELISGKQSARAGLLTAMEIGEFAARSESSAKPGRERSGARTN